MRVTWHCHQNGARHSGPEHSRTVETMHSAGFPAPGCCGPEGPRASGSAELRQVENAPPLHSIHRWGFFPMLADYSIHEIRIA